MPLYANQSDSRKIHEALVNKATCYQNGDLPIPIDLKQLYESLGLNLPFSKFAQELEYTVRSTHFPPSWYLTFVRANVYALQKSEAIDLACSEI